MLGKHFQQQYNHEICTTTLFLWQNVWGGAEGIMSPLSKSWGGHVPSMNSVPVCVYKLKFIFIAKNENVE